MFIALIILLVGCLIAISVVSVKYKHARKSFKLASDSAYKLRVEMSKNEVKFEKKVTLLEEDKLSLKEENGSLKKENDKYHKALKEVLDEKDKIIAEYYDYKELKKKYNKLQGDNKALNQTNSALNNKISEMDANNKSLSGNVLSCGNELANVRRELETANIIKTDQAKHIEELREQVDDLTRKNKSLLSSAGGYEKSNKDLRSKLGFLANEYEKLSNENKLLAEESVKIIGQYNELVDEYNKVSGNDVAKIEYGPKEEEKDESESPSFAGKVEELPEDDSKETEQVNATDSENHSVDETEEEVQRNGVRESDQVKDDPLKQVIKYGKKKKNKKR